MMARPTKYGSPMKSYSFRLPDDIAGKLFDAADENETTINGKLIEILDWFFNDDVITIQEGDE